MPLVAKFKFLIQRLFYPSIDRIHKVTSPILFVRGMQDEIVPNDHTERLFKAATSSKFKTEYKVANGCHNQSWLKGGDEYIVAFNDFFKRCDKEN
jgi:fermentation-respiration switch protein FrsA (DUF1100 family)